MDSLHANRMTISFGWVTQPKAKPETMKLFSKDRIRTLRSWEEVALAELPVLYRVAKRLTSNTTLAEDLVAQTLLDAGKAWDAFDGEFTRSWLIRILQNNFKKDIRRAASRPQTLPIEEQIVAKECDVWGELNWGAIGPQIIEEVDSLLEEYRMTITLCDIEEMSYEEAAEAMGVPIGTVRSRLFRARRILREKLAHYVDGYEPVAGGTNAGY